MESAAGRLKHHRAARAIHFPTEAEVPETKLHFRLRTALYLIASRELSARACLGSDQFVYWNAKDPRRCLAPDVFLKLGGPDRTFDSWKTWERGTPELAVEILSEHEPWDDKLDRYHELGIRELVSFEPGSGQMRVWDRIDEDLVERVVEGSTTPCLTLAAHWLVAPIDGDAALRLAHDAAGAELWPTPTEAERAEQTARRAEQTARLAAEARIAELEAELRRRR